MLEINVEEELTKTQNEMDEAEDSLAVAGFSVEQWDLIKDYILLAIQQNNLVQLKAVQNLGR
jgi:hypothetical protein